MKLILWGSLVLAAAIGGRAAVAAGNDVVIGVIDDLTGVYSDNGGVGAIEAVKMAIADFGGSVLNRKIVLLTADHQNKADIGASKAREWTDQRGLNMLLGGHRPLSARAEVRRFFQQQRAQSAGRHQFD